MSDWKSMLTGCAVAILVATFVLWLGQEMVARATRGECLTCSTGKGEKP